MRSRYVSIFISCLLALPLVPNAWSQSYLEQQRDSTLRDTRGKLAHAEQELADLRNRQARWNEARNRGNYWFHAYDCRGEPISPCLSRCKTYMEGRSDLLVMCVSQSEPPHGPRVLAFAPRGSLPYQDQLPRDQQQRYSRELYPDGKAMMEMQGKIDKLETDIAYYRSRLGEQRARRSLPPFVPMPGGGTGQDGLLGQEFPGR